MVISDLEMVRMCFVSCEFSIADLFDTANLGCN